MIKRCDRCGKPLIEFETEFHHEAGSPPAISGKCWVCSGAEMHFMDGSADKPHHRLEFFVCILAIALIAALFVPVLPYLNMTEVPLTVSIYSYIMVIAYFAIGTLATVIIRKRRGKRPNVYVSDPPLNRYEHTYGPNTDIYKTTYKGNGKFETTKETRLGGSINDRWGAHASSGSPMLDGVSNFYGKLIVYTLTPCLYLLLGGTFAFWVIPYLIYIAVKDNMAKSRNQAAPKELLRAYRHCRKLYGEAPISYDDKAGFLVKKSEQKAKKAEEKSSFLSNYTTASDDGSAPFFHVKRGGVTYMIVDYKRDDNKNYGLSFVLVKNANGTIQKRIVVGDGFIPTDHINWENEWKEAGVSRSTLDHMAWYEAKLKKL